MNMLDLLSTVRIAHIACYCKCFLLHYIQVLCQYGFCKAYHAYLTYLMLQRHLSHFNGHKLVCIERLHNTSDQTEEKTLNQSQSYYFTTGRLPTISSS
jgi:hypothetical protein